RSRPTSPRARRRVLPSAAEPTFSSFPISTRATSRTSWSSASAAGWRSVRFFKGWHDRSRTCRAARPPMILWTRRRLPFSNRGRGSPDAIHSEERQERRRHRRRGGSAHRRQPGGAGRFLSLQFDFSQNTMTLDVPSDLGMVGDAVELVANNLPPGTLSPRRISFNLRTALAEALGNAIRYGTGEDPDRSIRVRV